MRNSKENITAYVEVKETEKGTFYSLQLVNSESGKDKLAKNGIPKGSIYPSKSAVKEDVANKLGLSIDNVRVLQSDKGIVKLWNISEEFKIEELAHTNKALKQQGESPISSNVKPRFLSRFLRRN
ncbi:hypothetical protein [Psychrobacter sp. DWR1-2-3]|uniref:hypothetical protein n=1 Tax=Psychrobacter sp. DWR1-2-3 TaxID=2804637 RepID=UPI003CF1D048